MDILDQFKESRSKLVDIEKKLFNLFEENDVYKVIPYFNLSHVSITEAENANEVHIELHNYKDLSPQFAFICDRELALSIDQSVVSGWLAISKETLEKINTQKGIKFLKSFGYMDHELISILIQAYPELFAMGKVEGEIAEMCAKYKSLKLEERSKIGVQV